MIKGIGTDIVEVARIKKSLDKGDEFKLLVFHKDEIMYCESRGRGVENYAGRFAAKEAFLKALGTGWSGKLALNEIIFKNDDLGKPLLSLVGETRSLLSDYLNFSFHVSISHTSQYATAVVIVEEHSHV